MFLTHFPSRIFIIFTNIWFDTHTHSLPREAKAFYIYVKHIRHISTLKRGISSELLIPSFIKVGISMSMANGKSASGLSTETSVPCNEKVLRNCYSRTIQLILREKRRRNLILPWPCSIFFSLAPADILKILGELCAGSLMFMRRVATRIRSARGCIHSSCARVFPAFSFADFF